MTTVQPFGLTFMESVPPQPVPTPLAGAVLDQQRHIATFNGRPLCELLRLDEEMNSSSQTNTDGEDSITGLDTDPLYDD
jgi:putative ATP-grasp target RiPP